ncbi:ATP-grasp domain-containing protein [Calditrichota bacterium GD2]
MKIGIHHTKGSFSERWIAYCENKDIPYKLVNCYKPDIIRQLDDCDAFMWHFYQANYKDALFAKQLIYSLQLAGKKVFPDFNTMWHFDDKVGQKYLLEAIGAPLVPSYVFYTQKEALQWIEQTTFPKVFKLRGGAGSQNVKLVKTKKQAINLVKKAFGKGFKQYQAFDNFKERWRKYKLGKTNLNDVIRGIIRFVYPTEYARMRSNEKGYVYFQDFIPNNKFDIRVVVVDDKSFALKRLTRENDFRASGSGHLIYRKSEINDKCVKIAFEVNKKIQSQCIAFDFVFDSHNNPLIVEISYGFSHRAYDLCEGYWDKELNWHEGRFNPYGWMVDILNK